MADVSKTCDVFISHVPEDTQQALVIASSCRTNGLNAITYADLLPALDLGDALWDALAECRALVAVLSRSAPTPPMALVLGAAQAWNKAIYGIVPDATFHEMPPGFSGIPLYTRGRIDEVIRAIKSTGRDLSEADRSLLSALYADIGVTVDQLALDPGHLEVLVKRFCAGTGQALSGERLLSELLRMRKQGHLPRVRSSRRCKPRRGTA